MIAVCCEVCKETFQAQTKKARYCSESCKNWKNYQKRARPRKEVEAKICFCCGKEFVNRRNKLYCSKECEIAIRQGKAKNPKSLKHRRCSFCRRGFTKYNHSGRRYCSPWCKQKADYYRSKPFHIQDAAGEKQRMLIARLAKGEIVRKMPKPKEVSVEVFKMHKFVTACATCKWGKKSTHAELGWECGKNIAHECFPWVENLAYRFEPKTENK